MKKIIWFIFSSPDEATRKQTGKQPVSKSTEGFVDIFQNIERMASSNC